MKIAFVGKGGSGKSAVAGTFARLLARRGEPVLVLDSDPMPGLAFSLGAELDEAGIPDEAVEEHPDERPRFRLRADLTAEDAVERYAAVAPDGVRILQVGKTRGHISALIRSQFAFRQIVAGLDGERWNLVGDLPGGTRQPFYGWGDFADTIVVVVEPTAKSVLSGRRLARLAAAEEAPRVVVLANKVRAEGDGDDVSRRTGLPLIGEVPWDEELGDAERLGRAPVDHAPDSAAVRAVESMLDRLREEARR